MIVEGVDALKGAIRPLSLDCPLIAVTEDNLKDSAFACTWSSRRYPAQKRQFGDDPVAFGRTPRGSSGPEVFPFEHFYKHLAAWAER